MQKDVIEASKINECRNDIVGRLGVSCATPQCNLVEDVQVHIQERRQPCSPVPFWSKSLAREPTPHWVRFVGKFITARKSYTSGLEGIVEPKGFELPGANSSARKVASTSCEFSCFPTFCGTTMFQWFDGA